ncbi:MAG TPA: wax ester/triacylglycerol synthase family O-acyltransferase [Actinomycetota bacterium]|nr:wax ester/triacylglycerol synthase family O-acyltransferase [Actinomycetota bacterium]
MVGEQLSPLDALFLNIERPNTPMHTAGVVIFDGSSEFQKVYENIESRLPLVPRFFQRLAFVPLGLGQPFWVDDPSFDLSYHLRHAALPAPGTDEQLCDFAARVISRQLDRSKPLWEIYVIEGLTEGRSAIITKTHHAMVDGLSSMDLATVLLDFEREPAAHSSPPEKPAPEPLPSPSSLLARAVSKQVKEVASLGGALRTAASAPAKVAGTVRQTAGAVARTAGSLVKPAADSPLNVETGLHRRFAMVRSTLQTFKDIKNVAGSTVNDVILAVCADALGRLLRNRGERTEGMSIRVMVPVSVRDETQKMALGNEVASLFPDLPIGKMAPLDRLAVIHDKLAGLKESGQALGADAIVNATRWAPPTLHALAARLGTRARLMNTVISNVPGPQVPLYSCGQMMLEPYAVIPLSRGQSLAIGVTSYNDGIFFGMNADRDAHPDLSVLAGYIDEAIGDLEQAASKRPAAEVTHAQTEIAVGAAE